MFNCQILFDYLSQYLCVEEIIKNTFFKIFTTLAKDLVAAYSLNQSPLYQGKNIIFTTQSSSKTSYDIQFLIFFRSQGSRFISYSQNKNIHIKDVFGVSH